MSHYETLSYYEKNRMLESVFLKIWACATRLVPHCSTGVRVLSDLFKTVLYFLTVESFGAGTAYAAWDASHDDDNVLDLPQRNVSRL
jgi:hypothetical protein